MPFWSWLSSEVLSGFPWPTGEKPECLSWVQSPSSISSSSSFILHPLLLLPELPLSLLPNRYTHHSPSLPAFPWLCVFHFLYQKYYILPEPFSPDPNKFISPLEGFSWWWPSLILSLTEWKFLAQSSHLQGFISGSVPPVLLPLCDCLALSWRAPVPRNLLRSEGAHSILKHLRLGESSPLSWTDIHIVHISFNSEPM